MQEQIFNLTKTHAQVRHPVAVIPYEKSAEQFQAFNCASNDDILPQLNRKLRRQKCARKGRGVRQREGGFWQVAARG
jgi:hypothetical protein